MSNAPARGHERLAPWQQFDCGADPFRGGFDQRFVYLGEAQRGLLENLRDDLGSARGIVVVTGPAGTGKTTLLHHLVEGVRSQGTTVFFVANPGSLPTLAALIRACRGQSVTGDDEGGREADPATALRTLLRRGEHGQSHLLIIDDVQSAQDQLIMELATTTAADGHARLPIVLAGQPSFAGRLTKSPLNEHVGVISPRYELHPLPPADVDAFIRHRLQAAGCGEPVPFTTEAVQQIARCSKGIPASITTLCQLALVFAARRGERLVTADIVDLAAAASLFNPGHEMRSRVSGGAAAAIGSRSRREAPEPCRPPLTRGGAAPRSRPNEGAPRAAQCTEDMARLHAASGVDAPEVAPAMKSPGRDKTRRRRRFQLGFWGSALAPAVMVAALGAVALTPVGSDKLRALSGALESGQRSIGGRATAPTTTPAEQPPAQVQPAGEPVGRTAAVAGAGPAADAARAAGTGRAAPAGTDPLPGDQHPQPTELRLLLALAERYVEEDRLVAPRFDNALSVYREVLQADPGNPQALEGLAAIKSRLKAYAQAEAARGDLTSARRQLSKLQLVDAETVGLTGSEQAGASALSGADPDPSTPPSPAAMPEQ